MMKNDIHLMNIELINTPTPDSTKLSTKFTVNWISILRLFGIIGQIKIFEEGRATSTKI